MRAPCLLPSLPSHTLAIVLSPSWTANSLQGRLDLTVISDCCCSRDSLVRRKFVLLFCMALVSAFSLLTMTLLVIKSKTKSTPAESKTARVAMSVQNTRNQGPRKHVDRIPFVQFSRQFPRQTLRPWAINTGRLSLGTSSTDPAFTLLSPHVKSASKHGA